MASISDEETKTAAATGVEDEQQKTEEETSEGEDEAKKRLAAAAPDLKEPKKDKTEDAAPVEESSKNKPKRMCRFPGCNKVIKSQGHCQRHGAIAKRCRVEGCDKQAQGTHDGMCKRHWRALQAPVEPANNPPSEPAAASAGDSVYSVILPQSIAYRPAHMPITGDIEIPSTALQHTVMPLITYLQENVHKPAGWHRNSERQARGLGPVSSLSCQLETWERQLALFEIMLLSGGIPQASFKDLAHAWGREKGFHTVLTSSVCERWGEVERKRRSDLGRTLSTQGKSAFKEKLKKRRNEGSAVQQEDLLEADEQSVPDVSVNPGAAKETEAEDATENVEGKLEKAEENPDATEETTAGAAELTDNNEGEPEEANEEVIEEATEGVQEKTRGATTTKKRAGRKKRRKY